MTEKTLSRPEPANAREIVASRVIDAPLERVYRAFSDPGHLSRWWGPNGFTNTFDEFDFRPGGAWRFVMHGPDATSYRMEHVFREVSPERVVFDHLIQTSSDHHFEMTITFTRQGSRTLVGWRQLFDSAAERERVASVVAEATEQNLERLATEVAAVA